MKGDETHSFPDPAKDALDNFILHLPMGRMAPPDQNVGIREHTFSQAMLRFLERNRADLQVSVFPQGSRDAFVHPFGVYLPNDRVPALMHILAPNSDSNLARHSEEDEYGKQAVTERASARPGFPSRKNL
jgi:hypothetical protein